MTKNNKKLYSEEMRQLSFLAYEELTVYGIRWNILDPDEEIIENYGIEKYAQIPPATPMRINALKQILESLENPAARVEWANRIEGKPMQTTVNVSHETTSIEELEKYTTAKLDKLFEGME